MSMIIYTKPHCDKCEDIKGKLKEKSVEFEAKGIEEPGVMDELKAVLSEAGLSSPLMPILKFADGKVVSNDMGLYKELRSREII